MKKRTKVMLSTLGVLAVTGGVLTFSLVDCSEENDGYDDGNPVATTPVPEPVSDDILPFITDPNFLTYCEDQMGTWDKNGDGMLSSAEAAVVTDINVNSKAIASLAGIEYFTGLTSLRCMNNSLTYLDVTKCTSLTNLECMFNKLTDLDVSQNTKLVTLQCQRNAISWLDVINNPSLTRLSCGNNQLSWLDVSRNVALNRLDCDANQLIELDLSNNTELAELECSNNQLSYLDCSKLIKLEYCNCNGNGLVVLDVSNSPNMYTISCQSNMLASIDVSKNTSLMNLICYGNPGSNGVFNVRTSRDLASIPNSFTKGSWQFEGQTVTVNYQKG